MKLSELISLLQKCAEMCQEDPEVIVSISSDLSASQEEKEVEVLDIEVALMSSVVVIKL